MPFITVQLGQCGNQLGTAFFNSLMNDTFGKDGSSQTSLDQYQKDLLDRFFIRNEAKGGKSSYTPRSVLIDMESKKAGSGNNWAHGYCVHGKECDAAIDDLIRTQVEDCDRFDGFLCLMSLAGGTGSGLGTYVTEMLRDVYPKAFILNEVVAPYQSGEVIVQSYNSLLSLAHLYRHADGLIIVENDPVQQICAKRLGLKHVSFTHINKVISHQMSHFLAPATSTSGSRNFLGDFVQQLYAHPSYRLSSLLSIPMIADANIQYSTFQWESTVKTLRQMLIAKAHMEEGINWGMKVRPASDYNRSVANALVLRGKGAASVPIDSLNEGAMYPKWLPANQRLQVYTNSRPFSGYEKSASLLTNSQISIDTIDKLVLKAWNMFTSKAYVHQYEKHGLTSEDFLDCFTILESVICDYQRLSIT